MQLRLDKVHLSTDIDTYLNYETVSSTITLTGTIANLSSQTFSAVIPYSRDKTRAEIFIKNTNTGIKRPLWGGVRQGPYQFISSEVYTQFASYGGEFITVSLTVSNNTGGSINLINQVMEVTLVLIEVPTIS